MINTALSAIEFEATFWGKNVPTFFGLQGPGARIFYNVGDHNALRAHASSGCLRACITVLDYTTRVPQGQRIR